MHTRNVHTHSSNKTEGIGVDMEGAYTRVQAATGGGNGRTTNAILASHLGTHATT